MSDNDDQTQQFPHSDHDHGSWFPQGEQAPSAHQDDGTPPPPDGTAPPPKRPHGARKWLRRGLATGGVLVLFLLGLGIGLNADTVEVETVKEVPGPERVVEREVEVEVPGPERTVEVEVPGPTETVEVEVPGPEVEVEVTPQVCIDANDIGAEIIRSTGSIFSETVPAALDAVDRRDQAAMDALTEDIDEYAIQLEADITEFNARSLECAMGASN